jgi:hypothetical protein
MGQNIKLIKKRSKELRHRGDGDESADTFFPPSHKKLP